MSANIYRNFEAWTKAGNSIALATVKALIVDDNHAFAYDDVYVDDISANELTSYTRSAVANIAVATVDGQNKVSIDCDDIVFSSVGTGQTAATVILYIQIGGDDTTPEDDILIGSFDFTSPVTTNGQNITAEIPATGFAVLDMSPA